MNCHERALVQRKNGAGGDQGLLQNDVQCRARLCPAEGIGTAIYPSRVFRGDARNSACNVSGAEARGCAQIGHERSDIVRRQHDVRNRRVIVAIFVKPGTYLARHERFLDSTAAPRIIERFDMPRPALRGCEWAVGCGENDLGCRFRAHCSMSAASSQSPLIFRLTTVVPLVRHCRITCSARWREATLLESSFSETRAAFVA